MSEAAEVFVDWAFHALNPEHILVSAFADNPGSQGVIRKLGGQHTGQSWTHSASRGVETLQYNYRVTRTGRDGELL